MVVTLPLSRSNMAFLFFLIFFTFIVSIACTAGRDFHSYDLALKQMLDNATESLEFQSSINPNTFQKRTWKNLYGVDKLQEAVLRFGQLLKPESVNYFIEQVQEIAEILSVIKPKAIVEYVGSTSDEEWKRVGELEDSLCKIGTELKEDLKDVKMKQTPHIVFLKVLLVFIMSEELRTHFRIDHGFGFLHRFLSMGKILSMVLSKFPDERNDLGSEVFEACYNVLINESTSGFNGRWLEVRQLIESALETDEDFEYRGLLTDILDLLNFRFGETLQKMGDLKAVGKDVSINWEKTKELIETVKFWISTEHRERLADGLKSINPRLGISSVNHPYNLMEIEYMIGHLVEQAALAAISGDASTLSDIGSFISGDLVPVLETIPVMPEILMYRLRMIAQGLVGDEIGNIELEPWYRSNSFLIYACIFLSLSIILGIYFVYLAGVKHENTTRASN